jgi:hypothetical protein
MSVISVETTTGFLLTTEQAQEYHRLKNFKTHITCWPSCGSNRNADCDCGFDVLNAGLGETGWCCPMPITAEIDVMVARVREILETPFGLSQGRLHRPEDEALRMEIREMTKRLSPMIRSALAAKTRVPHQPEPPSSITPTPEPDK